MSWSDEYVNNNGTWLDGYGCVGNQQGCLILPILERNKIASLIRVQSYNHGLCIFYVEIMRKQKAIQTIHFPSSRQAFLGQNQRNSYVSKVHQNLEEKEINIIIRCFGQKDFFLGLRPLTSAGFEIGPLGAYLFFILLVHIQHYVTNKKN